jgi:hypothetical protein
METEKAHHVIPLGDAGGGITQCAAKDQRLGSGVAA